MHARSARTIIVAGLAVIAGTAALPAFAAEWKPAQPIRIIVPWAAGGSTDRLIRVIAGELQAAMGQQVVVVNQTGASGSIGTKAALDAPRDGYTFTAGAVQDLGAYGTLGLLDISIKDWHLFLAVRNAPLVTVNNDTPYQTFADLIDGMKKNPGKISVGTSGIPSAAHTAFEAISKVADIKYRHVSYDGDAPTMVALVSGEIQATAQPAPGQSEMVRAKRVRPLAVVADLPLDIEGVGQIPPVTKTLPSFKAPGVVLLVGIFLPRGVPAEVVAAYEKAWKERMTTSAALKKYAAQNGSLFAPAYGEEAQRLADPAVREVVWLHADGGRAKVSPDKLGIARP